MAAGPLGTSVMVPGNDNAAYGLKMKGMMLGSASDRFRAANKQIANLVQKMGLPDEVKTSGQVSARQLLTKSNSIGVVMVAIPDFPKEHVRLAQ